MKAITKHHKTALHILKEMEQLKTDIDALTQEKIKSRKGTAKIIHSAHDISSFAYQLGRIIEHFKELAEEATPRDGIRSGRRVIVERLLRQKVLKAPAASAEEAEWRPPTNRELAYVTLLLGFGTISSGDSVETVIHREASAIGRLRKGLKALEAEVSKPVQRLSLVTRVGAPHPRIVPSTDGGSVQAGQALTEPDSPEKTQALQGGSLEHSPQMDGTTTGAQAGSPK